MKFRSLYLTSLWALFALVLTLPPTNAMRSKEDPPQETAAQDTYSRNMKALQDLVSIWSEHVLNSSPRDANGDAVIADADAHFDMSRFEDADYLTSFAQTNQPFRLFLENPHPYEDEVTLLKRRELSSAFREYLDL